MKLRRKRSRVAKDVDIRTNLKTVTWYDAVRKELSKEYIDSLNRYDIGKELLVTNKTYGIVKILKDVVIIIHENSTDGDVEVSIIPKKQVISIT